MALTPPYYYPQIQKNYFLFLWNVYDSRLLIVVFVCPMICLPQSLLIANTACPAALGTDTVNRSSCEIRTSLSNFLNCTLLLKGIGRFSFLFHPVSLENHHGRRPQDSFGKCHASVLFSCHIQLPISSGLLSYCTRNI